MPLSDEFQNSLQIHVIGYVLEVEVCPLHVADTEHRIRMLRDQLLYLLGFHPSTSFK